MHFSIVGGEDSPFCVLLIIFLLEKYRRFDLKDFILWGTLGFALLWYWANFHLGKYNEHTKMDIHFIRLSQNQTLLLCRFRDLSQSLLNLICSVSPFLDCSPTLVEFFFHKNFILAIQDFLKPYNQSRLRKAM